MSPPKRLANRRTPTRPWPVLRRQPAETRTAVGDLQHGIAMVPAYAHLDRPAVGHRPPGVVHEVPRRPFQPDGVHEDAGPVHLDEGDVVRHPRRRRQARALRLHRPGRRPISRVALPQCCGAARTSSRSAAGCGRACRAPPAAGPWSTRPCRREGRPSPAADVGRDETPAWTGRRDQSRSRNEFRPSNKRVQSSTRIPPKPRNYGPRGHQAPPQLTLRNPPVSGPC